MNDVVGNGLATKTKLVKMTKLLKTREVAPCESNFCKNCFLEVLCKGKLLEVSARITKKMMTG